mgnify:CR=1 FL=1
MKIEEHIVWTNLISRFIKDTNYGLKPIDRDVEVGDILEIDEKTGSIINYGSINNIINTDEFKEWMKTIKEGSINEVSNI